MANNLENDQVVVHGIDLNENGLYEAGEDIAGRCSSRNVVRTPTACASASPSSVWISWQGRFRPTRTNGTSCAETKSEIPVLVFESGETIAVGDDILAALERRYSSDPPGAREHRTRAAQNT